ncbi:hypothetical protein PMAYCL1PPCAC_27637, partial [Pristionchus mayeri]
MREMEGIMSTLEIEDRTEIHNQIRHLQSEADKYKNLSINVMTEMARMKEEWEERMAAQQRQFEQQLKEQKEALVGRMTDSGRLDETTDSSESSVSLADGQTEKCPKTISMRHPLHIDFVCETCKGASIRQRILTARTKQTHAA